MRPNFESGESRRLDLRGRRNPRITHGFPAARKWRTPTGADPYPGRRQRYAPPRAWPRNTDGRSGQSAVEATEGRPSNGRADRRIWRKRIRVSAGV
jgi:hypothetical protein